MFLRKRQDNQWQSISDLMTGLMVIFLFVCLGFLYQINDIKQKYNNERAAIYTELKQEFSVNEREGWSKIIDIDDKTLGVTFKEPSVFFDVGNSELNPDFKSMLDDFFPRYIKVLKRHSDSIVEVRIEGNASREYEGDPNTAKAYYDNMKLSQDRAFNVLTYVYGIDSISEDREWLRKILRANGASYSKANNDNAASRCVEISIIRNAEKELEELGIKRK